MENRKDIMTRVYVVYALVFVVALGIFGKILWIQFAEGKTWREKARKISLRYFDIAPVRGNIYDANGEFLATSVPIFDLRMDLDSTNIPDSAFRNHIDSLSICLTNFLKDRSATEYKSWLIEQREKRNRYLPLKKDATFDQLSVFRKFPLLRKSKNYCGLIAEVKNQRVTPYRQLAYRTIGYDKPDTKYDVGLEGAYSDELSGKSGRRLYQRIADGHWRALNNENEIEPVNGADIFTTIDIHLQDVAETALQKQLEANEADHGCAIVMEVKTGEIMAIANLGKTGEGTYEERQNYAIWESTEPGSTFKMFSLLAAFEDGKTEPGYTVDVTGGTTKFANRTMRDSHLGGGVMTVKQAFEKSSNVGVSKIIYTAYKDNPQAFIDRLYSFNIHEPLGLEIAGEGKPVVKSTKARSWSKVSLPWMSIGYEVALTPLQILTFYNAIANNGVMVKPHFVKEIRQGNQVTKKTGTTVINRRIASEEAIRKARMLLEGVVENGTGSPLKNPVYKVAGKTGTAQIAQGNAGYNKRSYKASFVGYFPADNPKYSCIVVINNPAKGVYYGGAISAPVFREIADRVYATDPEMALTQSGNARPAVSKVFKTGMTCDISLLSRWMGVPLNSLPRAEWVRIQQDSTGLQFAAVTGSVNTIPDVSGMGARDAVYLLERIGLKVKLQGKGLVRQQSLAPGSKALPGNLIILDLDV